MKSAIKSVAQILITMCNAKGQNLPEDYIDPLIPFIVEIASLTSDNNKISEDKARDLIDRIQAVATPQQVFVAASVLEFDRKMLGGEDNFLKTEAFLRMMWETLRKQK